MLERWGSPRAVFFDAVGTVLFPAVPAPQVYAETAARYGLQLDAAQVQQRFNAAFFHQEQLDETAGWLTSEERERSRWQAIVTESLPGAPEACFEWLFATFAQPQAWRVPSEVAFVLSQLQDMGLTLGLASNYDSRLNAVLAGRPELAPLAGRVVISSLVGVRKPGRAFFDHVIGLAGCAAGDILFVGDDLNNDFEGARAAGLQAVLLDAKNRHPGVAPRVKSLAELLDQS